MSVIAHNLTAMKANNRLSANTSGVSKSLQKLSSGYRINSAADDAAGLGISEKMRRQITGLSQGIENTQDGVSMCQVADGALVEVTNMLQRLTELSAQSANGIYSDEDRESLQQEVSQILGEIDRIGSSTTFNKIPVFKGSDTYMVNEDGSPVIISDIKVKDLTLADIDLGAMPFDSGSSANHLALQAVVNNKDSGAYGKDFNLIYGQGSTSNSTFNLTYTAADNSVKKVSGIRLDQLEKSNYNFDGDDTWTRDFTYTGSDGFSMTITQKVVLDESDEDNKKYKISYEFTNHSGTDANVQFMFHVDTAYNNNDICEGYFVDGQRIENNSMYSEDGKTLDGVASGKINTDVPKSISIVDVDNALAFSEKVTFDTGNPPDLVSVGLYWQIDEWSYYNNPDSNPSLGKDANRTDLGFSLQWSDDLSASGSVTYSLEYGITDTQKDDNLKDVSLTPNLSQTVDHDEVGRVWIQSGVEGGEGIWLEFGEMNSSVIGVDDVDVSTAAGAKRAMNMVKGALQRVMKNRGTIGAQQNRLEHTMANGSNMLENITDSESRIRDADVAKEMLKYTSASILVQSSQAMLAQANQVNQGVLTLLR